MNEVDARMLNSIFTSYSVYITWMLLIRKRFDFKTFIKISCHIFNE